jgi:DNA-binding NarL/FixJ family response regulator
VISDEATSDEATLAAGRAQMIRTVVVDDHAVVRQGLQALLDSADDIACVGMAADGAEAVGLVGTLLPDVVLMDLAMPVLDGVAATRAITARHPGVRVVVLTSLGDESRIRAALAAGARGYLLKHVSSEELLDAIRAAHAGDAPLDPRAGRVLLDLRRRPERELTPRELEVLRLVADGLANKQIARRLGISERTVKAHLTSIMQRVGVTDRVQAALWAHDTLPPLVEG